MKNLLLALLIIILIACSKQEDTVNFVKRIKENPETKIFEIQNNENEDPNTWLLSSVEGELLNQEDGFFLVRAIQIKPDGSITNCFIDLSMPERISDYVYFLENEKLIYDYHYKFKGDIICVVPSEIFGDYNLYYSKINPEPGINILKNGLKISKNKARIAEDLGYILRDENRKNEAIEMFTISANEGPSSYFIYLELSQLYAEIGDKDKSGSYKKKAEKMEKE